MTSVALAETRHVTHSSFAVTTCNEREQMSFTDKGTVLARALVVAYPGRGKYKQIAADLQCSEATAKNLLNGKISKSLDRFLRAVEKRPAILEHIIKNDWLAKLSLTREMATVRSSIESMEKRLAETAKRNRVGTD